MQLTFVKSGYILGVFILTLRDKDLEKGSIRDPEWYSIDMQPLFATDSFLVVGERRNNFVLISIVGGRRDGR